MTHAAIHIAIRSRFKTLVADAQSVATEYDNAPFTPPDGTIWARWSVLDGKSDQVSLRSPTARYRRTGVAIASIFAPLVKGTAAALALADTVVAAFRTVTADSVTYWTPSVQVIGREEPWWQVNVVCPWYSDLLA
jgi:hypothetical protein